MKDLTSLKQTMTSLEIAQVVKKNHFDVLKSIRNMEPAWEKVNQSKFALVKYKDSKGEMRPMYKLNAYECLFIATKFNDEARAKLVLRWAEHETKEKAQELVKPRKTREGVERLPYTQEELSLLEFIRTNLVEGDLGKIARISNYSRPNISLVLNAKHVNEQIVKDSYGVALNNYLSKCAVQKNIYNPEFVQDAMATINHLT